MGELQMGKMMLIGSMLGAAGITALGAIATNFSDKQASNPQWVEVISSKALTEQQQTQVERCEQQTVQQKKPLQDPHEITGTVLGAVVGGVLGNQVGGGNGKKLATIAGAAAGGYAGKQVQENMQQTDVSQQQTKVCRMVPKTVTKTVGYEVRYLHQGKVKSTVLQQKPTDRMLLQDGQLLAVSPLS